MTIIRAECNVLWLQHTARPSAWGNNYEVGVGKTGASGWEWHPVWETDIRWSSGRECCLHCKKKNSPMNFTCNTQFSLIDQTKMHIYLVQLCSSGAEYTNVSLLKTADNRLFVENLFSLSTMTRICRLT